MTGSLRYMAPEVIIGKPYSQTCDVYSFSVTLWEILSCKKPFAKQTKEYDFIKKVCTQHLRPGHCRFGNQLAGNKACQEVLCSGWDGNVKRRASMSTIQAKLQEELHRLQEKDASKRSFDGLRKSRFRLKYTRSSETFCDDSSIDDASVDV
jgi:serine/threonine protein kinase